MNSRAALVFVSLILSAVASFAADIKVLSCGAEVASQDRKASRAVAFILVKRGLKTVMDEAVIGGEVTPEQAEKMRNSSGEEFAKQYFSTGGTVVTDDSVRIERSFFDRLPGFFKEKENEPAVVFSKKGGKNGRYIEKRSMAHLLNLKESAAADCEAAQEMAELEIYRQNYKIEISQLKEKTRIFFTENSVLDLSCAETSIPESLYKAALACQLSEFETEIKN